MRVEELLPLVQAPPRGRIAHHAVERRRGRHVDPILPSELDEELEVLRALVSRVELAFFLDPSQLGQQIGLRNPRGALRERRELLVDLRPALIVRVRVVKVGRGVEERRGELPEGVHASQVVNADAGLV